MSEIPATCLAYDEELSALIDGELSVEREAEVRAHLDACARCRSQVEELCNVDLTLASAESSILGRGNSLVVLEMSQKPR